MSNTSLIIGESGTGKSTSLCNLNSTETFIINVLDKPLPFRGYRKNYIKLSPDGKTGNYYASDDYSSIIRIIKLVNERRPDIKNLIIDDWQYTMCNEFMRRATETGYTKFTEIGQHAWSIVRALVECREDLDCFVLSHSDTDANGKYKCKSIGKMLDEKITIEGMFTIVLHTQVMDGAYRFLTQNDGMYIAKSPRGLFEEKYIANDLAYVKEQMRTYYHEDKIQAAIESDAEIYDAEPDFATIIFPSIVAEIQSCDSEDKLKEVYIKYYKQYSKTHAPYILKLIEIKDQRKKELEAANDFGEMDLPQPVIKTAIRQSSALVGAA